MKLNYWYNINVTKKNILKMKPDDIQNCLSTFASNDKPPVAKSDLTVLDLWHWRQLSVSTLVAELAPVSQADKLALIPESWSCQFRAFKVIRLKY